MMARGVSWPQQASYCSVMSMFPVAALDLRERMHRLHASLQNAFQGLGLQLVLGSNLSVLPTLMTRCPRLILRGAATQQNIEASSFEVRSGCCSEDMTLASMDGRLPKNVVARQLWHFRRARSRKQHSYTSEDGWEGRLGASDCQLRQGHTE